MNDLLPVKNGGLPEFWKRKEGKLGMTVLAGGGIALLYGASLLLPFLISLTANLLTLGALGFGLLILWGIVTSKRFWQAATYLFKGAMWHLMDWAVGLDPVGIIKVWLEKIEGYLEDIDHDLRDLNGHIQKKNTQIEAKEKEYDQVMRELHAAKGSEEKYKGANQVNQKQATRLDGFIKELKGLRAKLQNVYDVLSKVSCHLKLKQEDLTNEVNIEIERREAYKSVGSVITSALKILKGGQGSEIYNLAMEKMANDTANEMGRYEDFFRQTGGLLDRIDLESEMGAQQAMELLDQWEKENLGPQIMLSHQEPAHLDQELQQPGKGRYTGIACEVLTKKK